MYDDDADCDLGLVEGEVFHVVCCVLLTVSILVPVLVVDGLVVDGLIFSITVETFGALLFALTRASVRARLNGVGVGALPAEGMALNNIPPSMSIFYAPFETSLQTFDFFSMAPLLIFE